MNRQFLVILVVLLGVVGGGALLVFQQQSSQKPAVSAQLGQPLLKSLKASEVASISIRDPKDTLTLVKKDDRWTLAEKNGFAADLDKVTDLVVKAIELKVGQAEPVGEKDRERLNLSDATATRVSFKAADGKLLAELLVGKKYFRKEPEGDASKSPGDGRFVMLPEDPKQVYTVSDPLRLATPATGEWVSREGFAIEKVRTLEVKPAEGADAAYRIERNTDGVDWKLDKARAGETLDIARANAASYSLNKVEIDDLADDKEDTGLDKATVVSVTTFDGLSYTLRIGALVKDRHFVKLAVEGTPKREFEARKDEKPEDREKREKAFAEELKKLEQRVTREKALAEFVLMVPKAKLADTLKKRSELLARKEEKKDAGKK